VISFDKKVAFITGGGTGIGLATAQLMADHGATIVLADIDQKALDHAAVSLAAHSDRVLCLRMDVSDATACTDAIERAAQTFGKIDFLVHCAGIYPSALVKDTSDADWLRLMNINLNSTFFLCRAVQKHLSEQGAIVLLGSLAGHRGSYAHAAYAATKGATFSFARSLAMELAPHARVNVVSPGIIKTAMTRDLLGEKGDQLLAATPLGRHGTVNDIAGTIAFLCSSLAAFITGETIQVNGGLYMS
jgi:3-oxoacyl-[acyl-carrier protein] reductase